VFKQPDLGSSLVYASFWGAMLLAGGLPIWFLVVCTSIVALLLPLFWSHLASYQKLRVTTFLDPELDPKGAGYNALQAMIAVGSGQFFGRDWGGGHKATCDFYQNFILILFLRRL